MKHRTWFAGFDGDEKLTAWYRSRDKPWSIMRRLARQRSSSHGLSIRSQPFIEPEPAPRPASR